MRNMNDQNIFKFEVIKDFALITLDSDDKTLKQDYGTKLFEHRITPIWINTLNKFLDNILDQKQIRAVVVQAKGRYFCNGLDLVLIKNYPDYTKTLQKDFEKLLARILIFPLPTIAILNGHCCAAGAMFALSFDFRVSVFERNTKYSSMFFIPALDIGLVYSRAMVELIKSKVSVSLSRDLLLFSKRLKFKELLENKIVDLELIDSNDEDIIIKVFSFVENSVFERDLYGNDRFVGEKYRETLQKNKLNYYFNAYCLLNSDDVEDMGFKSGTWNDKGRIKGSSKL